MAMAMARRGDGRLSGQQQNHSQYQSTGNEFLLDHRRRATPAYVHVVSSAETSGRSARARRHGSVPNTWNSNSE
jgi:hypothetical protein